MHVESFTSGGYPNDEREPARGLYLVLEPDMPVFTVVAASDAYLAATGETREALVGHSMLDIAVDGGERSREQQLLAASLERVIRNRGSDVMAVEHHRLRDPGGGYHDRWWRSTNSPVFDSDGQVRYILHCIEDVTAVVRVDELEDALHASEARFAGVIALTADAIISADDRQRVVIFNDGAEKIFGWKRADIIGKPLELLVPARFRDLHRAELAELAVAPVAEGIRHEWRDVVGLRADGSEFPCEETVSVIDVGGGTHLFTIVLRDITERRRAAAEQRLLLEVGMVLASTLDDTEILDRLAAMIVGSMCDCCVVHLVRDGELLRLKVAHRDPAKAAAVYALEHVPIDRGASTVALAAIQAGRPLLISEVTNDYLVAVARSEAHLRALQGIGATSLMWVPLVTHGRALGSLSLISTTGQQFDGGDLDLAQELAHRASLAVENARLYREVKDAIRVRDDVLGVIAHDLRSPLNTILLLSQALDHEGETISAHEASEVIGRATRRMNRLIQDLLDLARMQEGRLEVRRERVPPAEVVHEVEESQRKQLSRGSISLEIAMSPGLPDLSGERDEILRVLDHLLRNAIKFTPHGGRITIAAEQREHVVLFRIADTGEGIPADVLPHLFERFWEVRRVDRRGAGLGLTIAKGIVDAHGGKIWVESTPGVGTTVSFTIPIADTNAEGRS
jgi:PAS domain S-box-containing protein